MKEIKLEKLVKMTFEQVWAEDEYGLFYDWFCPMSSLPEKSRGLFGRLKSVVSANEKGRKFDPSATYAFFKNNCPGYGDGQLYDDIRICDAGSGKVLFNVCPRDPFGSPSVAFAGHGFDHGTEPLTFGSWEDLLAWFAGEEFDVAKGENEDGYDVWKAVRKAA